MATDYTSLITSEHRNKPKFSAMVQAVAGTFDAVTDLLLGMPQDFDIDTAIGAQLDIVGLWVGISRKIATPLQVYFSFDTDGLGFDQGNIKGPYDPDTGLVSLDDETYRVMLKARIGANNWDGTLPTLIDIYALVFDGTGSVVFVVDNQDMSLDFYAAGTEPSALMTALLKDGYFPLKPSGVSINSYTKSSVTGSPMFGFDIENAYISGFDVGAIGVTF